MGFVLVHPNLGGAQGISLGVVINVVVVGLLGALDVRHPGTREDLHAAAALPHLDKRGNGMHKEPQLKVSSAYLNLSRSLTEMPQFKKKSKM